jgi:hypothetical protein
MKTTALIPIAILLAALPLRGRVLSGRTLPAAPLCVPSGWPPARKLYLGKQLSGWYRNALVFIDTAAKASMNALACLAAAENSCEADG